MSRVRVRQSKNRLRSRLTEEEIRELRSKIRDPSYIDYVTSQLASIIFTKIRGDPENQEEKNEEDQRSNCSHQNY
ncbi:MAG: hypothetical protein RMJ37_00270 [Spirochaetia bacterium]|nr:hypothetical protein [Spirochaetota bacterium]MCX8097042.1 hypothetical protein [Spirochaetota bacterium]MDW8111763.1 hypothetical protein [Spirochaetia bacterium]